MVVSRARLCADSSAPAQHPSWQHSKPDPLGLWTGSSESVSTSLTLTAMSVGHFHLWCPAPANAPTYLSVQAGIQVCLETGKGLWECKIEPFPPGAASRTLNNSDRSERAVPEAPQLGFSIWRLQDPNPEQVNYRDSPTLTITVLPEGSHLLSKLF